MKGGPGTPPSGLGALWEGLGVGGRIAVVTLCAALLTYLLVAGVRRLGQRGRRSLLAGLTLGSLGLLLGLGTWARFLPELRGSQFVLWHQLVRAGAALGGMGFFLFGLGVVLPRLLNGVERRGFVPFVAARHVRAGKSGFLTVISFLSIAGVAVSSFALCAVVSVMGGFGADLKRKILGNNAHVRVDSETGGFTGVQELADELRLVAGVRAVTPVAAGEAMASSSSNTAGVLLKGVDTTTISTVIDLAENVEVGRLDWLDRPEQLLEIPPDTPIGITSDGAYYLKGPELVPLPGDPLGVAGALRRDDVWPGIVLGRELARSLHAYVGDEITLVAPLGELGPMGVLPKTRKFRVAAIFYSGMYEYDASHAYVRLEVAQELLDLGDQATALDIKAVDAEAVDAVREAVAARVPAGLRVRDWKQMNKNLFSALKVEKIGAFIILIVAIVVASFCIVCTLLLMVTEKTKEIAILKAVGSSDRQILGVFMTEGMIIGAIGTVFGVTAGLALSLGLRWFGVRLDPDVYYVDRLPINVDALEYGLVAASSLAITCLATLYPALAASRLRPVEGIRWE